MLAEGDAHMGAYGHRFLVNMMHDMDSKSERGKRNTVGEARAT